MCSSGCVHREWRMAQNSRHLTSGVSSTTFLRPSSGSSYGYSITTLHAWGQGCVARREKKRSVHMSHPRKAKGGKKKENTPIRARPFFPLAPDCPLNVPWAAAAAGPSNVVPSPPLSKASWRTAALDAAAIAFAMTSFWQELPVAAPCDAPTRRE
jgi:hypothetical protein